LKSGNNYQAFNQDELWFWSAELNKLSKVDIEAHQAE